jgi:hypothetical protein
MVIHVVDVDDGQPRSSTTTCSRCYLMKELGETVIYVFPTNEGYKSHYVEAYDICVDCLPFVKAQEGHPEVEAHRKKARENPYTDKNWSGRLEPYMHFDRSRWRTTNALMKGDKWPDYNIEGEPPVPGVTHWEKDLC